MPGGRKHTRFSPDDLATVSLDGKPALAVTESYKGCGLVMAKRLAPADGAEVSVRVGEIGPLKGVVRWRKDLDEDVVKIGIEYLE